MVKLCLTLDVFFTLNILIPGNIYSQFRTAFLSVETSIQIDKINKNLSN
jgi:hypothetical protein